MSNFAHRNFNNLVLEIGCFWDRVIRAYHRTFIGDHPYMSCMQMFIPANPTLQMSSIGHNGCVEKSLTMIRDMTKITLIYGKTILTSAQILRSPHKDVVFRANKTRNIENRVSGYEFCNLKLKTTNKNRK